MHKFENGAKVIILIDHMGHQGFSKGDKVTINSTVDKEEAEFIALFEPIHTNNHAYSVTSSYGEFSIMFEDEIEVIN